MNRTILIIIGLLCAVVTATGIMWYNDSTDLIESSHISTITVDLTETCQVIMFFPSGNYSSRAGNAQNEKEAGYIEKLTLDYIRDNLNPSGPATNARAEIKLSSKRRLAQYTLYLYRTPPDQDCQEGTGYVVELRKNKDEWLIIPNNRYFGFSETLLHEK